MGTITKVVCPECGMNMSDKKFEEDSEFPFGTWDVGKPIIQIRDAPGGKASNLEVGTGKYRRSAGRGFPLINSYTLDEAMDMPEYSDYVERMAVQLLKIAKIFHDKGLISDEEIDALK